LTLFAIRRNSITDDIRWMEDSMNKTLLFSAAPLALLAGCNQAPEPVDPEAVMAEIHAAEEAQLAAFNSDDIDAATAVYTADAKFLGPGSPVQGGTDAIRASFQGMIDDPNSAVEIESTGAIVSQSGDLAVTTGDLTFTFTGEDGAPTVMNLAVLSVWQKQEDGSWKMALDYNAPVPAPAPAE
jgi:uncharacterized protein (TIGR02246 family)